MSNATNDCEIFTLYSGKIQIKYCDDKHIYHVRRFDGEGKGGDWVYTPSVTSITRLLGGGKVEGLLYWAVDQTLLHLDKVLEDDVLVPSVDRVLDAFISRLSLCDQHQVSPFPPRLEAAVLLSDIQSVLNGLDNAVGLDTDRWKAARTAARDARKRTLDAAANLGNIVHDWLEGCILSRLGVTSSEPVLPENTKAARAIKKWLVWERAAKVEWKLTEQRIYSQQWSYTGCLDALALLDGVMTLVDFKTSKRVYDEHRFQTAAYAVALTEEFPGLEIKQRMVQRLSKTTGAVTPTILEDEGNFTVQDDFAAFIGLRAVYQRLKGA